MSRDKQMKQIERATKALLGMEPVPHGEPPKHTKKDLDLRFKMKVDRKGKGKVKEITE